MMSNVRKTFSVAFLVAAATLASSAAFARDDANACPSVTHVQRKIVERADQGMDSLRAYVWLTSRVYGIEMVDVKESLDNWRAAIVCQEQVAQDAAKVDVASKAVNGGDR
jgi:hypothetical protein